MTGYMRAGVLVLGTALLAGCQTTGGSTARMQGDIGSTVAASAVRNGPPTASFRMADGRQAFQWTKGGITGSADGFGSYTCVYTVFARPNGGSGLAGWRIVGFQPPAKGCDN